MPATVFTLCNVPSGYGMSSENNARFVSVLFKTIGQWILDEKPVSLEKIEQLKELVSVSKDVLPIVISLEEEFKTNNNNINIIKFLSKQKALSSLAQSISS